MRITPLLAVDTARRRLAWLAAEADDTPVGAAYLRLFDHEGQEHVAELTLNVHPAERRRGVGSALLEQALAGAGQEGRRTVLAQAAAGAPGDLFLAARGFRKVLGLTFSRLPLAEAGVPAEEAKPGYRLRSWDGLVPDELLDTFVASRRAMDDMPMDDADHGVVIWDAARVKAAVQAVEGRGELLHTVAAVDESDGSIAGFTELVVPGDGTGDGQHYGTGVLPGHRGHGLARWMKAEAIRQARRRHPRLGGLLADTADSNTYMRKVNDSLGYRPTHKEHQYQLDL